MSAWIQACERNRSLRAPARLRERMQALDAIERALLFHDPGAAGGTGLVRRAQRLQARLEAVDRRLFRRLRAAIRRGDGARGLQPWTQLGPDRQAGAAEGAAKDTTDATTDHTAPSGEDYDHLDALLAAVLAFAPPRDQGIEPDAEMVFYQPTPARHVFDLLRRLRLGEHDVLIDLGAGLGHVPLTVAACTAARSIGIELEPAYVEIAEASARGLNLQRARFVQADARAADLSAGTVFYLYTPFTGSILTEVLERLRGIARSRAIRVCTLGPCTATVAAEAWLRGPEALRGDRVAIFDSRRAG